MTDTYSPYHSFLDGSASLEIDNFLKSGEQELSFFGKVARGNQEHFNAQKVLVSQGNYRFCNTKCKSTCKLIVISTTLQLV